VLVRRLSLFASLGVLALVLAACSSAPSSESQNASNTPTSHAGAARSSTTTAASAVPASVPNQDNVRKDVTLSNCGAVSGGWSAGGTVKNSMGHQATYQITVFFTDTGATDLAYGVTNVPVAAGKSSPWSVTTRFAAPSQVLCVLRGVAAN